MGLNDLQARKIQPRNTRFELTDEKGLVLLVLPSGTKSWILRYQFEGKARRITLGEYPNMSLMAARNEARLIRADIKQGVDPALKRSEENATRKAAPTVADLLEEYWAMELKDTPSGKNRKRMVEKDALPVWGKRKVATITRRDAVLLVDNVRERAPIMANRLQGVLVRMFNFAAERGILELSPLTGMKKKPEKACTRVLTDEEIKLLWQSLDLDNMTMDIYRVSKLALKMILLTGQRSGEVCGMTWEEIDSEGFWNIPAERMKSREAQRVPLTGMALEVLENVRIYSGESRFVFRSSHKDNEPMTAHALSRAIARHWQELGFSSKWTPHDLRRTLRTRLAEIGIDDVVAERVLGHKLQGIMAVYNQHKYDIEKRQALELWAKKLRQIVGIEELKPGNIIEMRPVASQKGIN